jgi:acyl-CoA thioester hydrolase
VQVQERGRASLAFAQQAWRLGPDGSPAVLLAEGTIRIGCVDAATIRPRRIPTPILERLAAER